MREKFSQRAFTLFELIISLVFVVLISLGLMAVNGAISNNGQDYGQRFSVKSQTQAVMNHIINNASLTVGSAGGGTAIVTTINDTVCFHQNISPPPYASPMTIDNAPVLNTPDDTSDDRWLCYTWFPDTYQVQYCAMPFSSAAAACAESAAGSNYLGTAFTSPFSNANMSFTYPPANPPANPAPIVPLLFTITVQDCLNNSAQIDGVSGTGHPSCSATGTSLDPVHNPEAQITQYVTPSQVGP